MKRQFELEDFCYPDGAPPAEKNESQKPCPNCGGYKSWAKYGPKGETLYCGTCQAPGRENDQSWKVEIESWGKEVHPCSSTRIPCTAEVGFDGDVCDRCLDSYPGNDKKENER